MLGRCSAKVWAWLRMLVTAPWFTNTHVETCMDGVIICLKWIALFVLALLLLVLELGDVVVVNDANLPNLLICWLPRLL